MTRESATGDATVRPPLRRFVGAKILVSGAGTGFGAALARQAAAEGAATVFVHYNRSKEGAEHTAEQVRAAGAEPILVRADIRDWDAVVRLADDVFEQAGGLDVLVNNVGDMAVDQMSWRDITEEGIDRVLAVDIKGTLMMVHQFGTRMLDQGHGAIINIASTVIAKGSPRAPQYAAGKYGVLGITKSYAAAFAPNVRVNCFAPGFMETEAMLTRDDFKSGRRETLIASTPAGRIPSPAELAPAALFLASDEANHMIGTLMICDGGLNMIGA